MWHHRAAAAAAAAVVAATAGAGAPGVVAAGAVVVGVEGRAEEEEVRGAVMAAGAERVVEVAAAVAELVVGWCWVHRPAWRARSQTRSHHFCGRDRGGYSLCR
jgi:hypothetical protein|eukprot:SAG25_NODE_172_length_13022_cov_64.797500_1_plen_103_part_00